MTMANIPCAQTGERRSEPWHGKRVQQAATLDDRRTCEQSVSACSPVLWRFVALVWACKHFRKNFRANPGWRETNRWDRRATHHLSGLACRHEGGLELWGAGDAAGGHGVG